MTRDEAEKIVRRALTEPRPLCDACDGCGWYEGGRELQTECEQCLATGHADAGDVFDALAVLAQKPPEGVPEEVCVSNWNGKRGMAYSAPLPFSHLVYRYSHTVTINSDRSLSDD